jgi:predicted RecB family nuclease
VSFILIAEKPIFSDEASKKAWLIVTVGAVANVMNAHNTIKSSDVLVSDRHMMKKRKGYKYPIALAKSLQRQTKAHQIGLEELYQQLNVALIPNPIPRK